MSDTIIRVKNVKKDYELGMTVIPALKGVSFEIAEGEFLSIVGPSGCGKSTLLNIIGCIDKATSGQVTFQNVDLETLNDDQEAEIRLSKVGFIFQSFNLIPVMTCLENVTLPMSFAGMQADAAWDKGLEILKMVGLGHRALHKPGELSGGQQQRVAIARSLANSPEIILADEPTANLDQRTGEEIIEVFAELKATLGVTIITATHDLKMLKRSDRIMWIADGRIDRIAKPSEIDFSNQEFH